MVVGGRCIGSGAAVTAYQRRVNHNTTTTRGIELVSVTGHVTWLVVAVGGRASDSK